MILTILASVAEEESHSKSIIMNWSMLRYMKSFEHDQLMYEEGRLAEIENTERENSLYVKMVS